MRRALQNRSRRSRRTPTREGFTQNAHAPAARAAASSSATGLRQDEEGNRAQVAVFDATQDRRRVDVGEVEVEDDERRPRYVAERRLPTEEREGLGRRATVWMANAGTPVRGSAAPRGRSAGCRRRRAPAPERCRPLALRAAADSRYVRARPTGGVGRGRSVVEPIMRGTGVALGCTGREGTLQPSGPSIGIASSIERQQARALLASPLFPRRAGFVPGLRSCACCPRRRERRRWHGDANSRAEESHRMPETTADVLIIGAGAVRGRLRLEPGGHAHEHRLPRAGRLDGSRAPTPACAPMGGHASSATSPSAPTRAGGARTTRSTTRTRPSPTSMFNAVGGSTILYAAHFPRFHPADFRVRTLRRRRRRLADRLRAARAVLRRQRPHDGRVRPGRRPRVPAEGGAAAARPARERSATTLASGFNRLGWHWWPSDSAITTAGVRRPRALHQRRHLSLGCPPGRQGQHRRHLLARRACAKGVHAADRLPRARDHRRRDGMADGVIYYDADGGRAAGRRRRSWCWPATASARRACS